ncbi:hypothetical protein ACRAWD_29735 [Caulobacter segnis]
MHADPRRDGGHKKTASGWRRTSIARRNGQPLDQALPVLERTPYDKLSTNHGDRTRLDLIPRAKPELAVDSCAAAMSWRSRTAGAATARRGCSRSTWSAEGADGYDTVASAGQASVLGATAGWRRTARRTACPCPERWPVWTPPALLAAMFLDSGGSSSAYHSGTGRRIRASSRRPGPTSTPCSALATKADPARRAALDAQDLRAWFRVMPWSENHSRLSAAPEYEKHLLEQWRNGLFGPSLGPERRLCARLLRRLCRHAHGAHEQLVRPLRSHRDRELSGAVGPQGLAREADHGTLDPRPAAR